MSELLLDIMVAMNVDSVSFCFNYLVVLLMYSQVKAEKHQVRKVGRNAVNLLASGLLRSYRLVHKHITSTNFHQLQNRM